MAKRAKATPNEFRFFASQDLTTWIIVCGLTAPFFHRGAAAQRRQLLPQLLEGRSTVCNGEKKPPQPFRSSDITQLRNQTLKALKPWTIPLNLASAWACSYQLLLTHTTHAGPCES